MNDELMAKLKRARQEVNDVASGRRRWTMCVPAQPDDTDILLANALDHALAALETPAPSAPGPLGARCYCNSHGHPPTAHPVQDCLVPGCECGALAARAPGPVDR